MEICCSALDGSKVGRHLFWTLFCSHLYSHTKTIMQHLTRSPLFIKQLQKLQIIHGRNGSRRAVLEQSDRDLEEILTEIGQTLKKAEHKQLGLTLVTKMLIANDREVSIDFLDLVADELHASKAARSDLLTPWSQVNNGLQQFRRCTFNRPETLLRESLFSAIPTQKRTSNYLCLSRNSLLYAM